MKRLFYLLFITTCSIQTAFGQNLIIRPARAVLADHTVISLFDSLPDSIVSKAAAITLMFRHASVGTTINDGLNCLQGTRTNPTICTTFPDYKYDRRKWVFEPRGNSGWYGKINDFVSNVHSQVDTYEIFSFKYCYLEGLDQVAEPCGGGNFNPALVKKAWDSLRTNMEKLESKYPEKLFIWWTIPLTQVGMHCTDTLNFLIRKYCRDNNKVLFDIADIEAWDTNGQHVISPAGYEMAFKGYCGEQQPGAQACHPNWTGKVLLAKAYWWMMCSISGYTETTTHHIPEVPFALNGISPNPVSDEFRLSISSLKTTHLTIEITDIAGRSISKTYTLLEAGKQTVSLYGPGLRPGCYLMVVSGSGYSITRKLFIGGTE